MLEIDVPGWRTLRREHLVLDLNGSLTVDVQILEGIEMRVSRLHNLPEVELPSADTLGRLDDITARLGVRGRRLERGQPEAQQKLLCSWSTRFLPRG